LAVQTHPGFPSKDEEMKEQVKKTKINGALKQRYYEPLINWLWGYDFFISYHWESGGTYAVNLAAKLRDRGYDVFLDRSEYAMGDKWKKVGEIALRNTHRLVLIGTRDAIFNSKPVEHEVVTFTDRGRQCIPIFFGNTFSIEAQENRSKNVVLDRMPVDTLHVEDTYENLTIGPSIAVIEKLTAAHGIMRRRQLRRRFIVLIILVLTLLVVATAIAAIYSAMAWKNEQASYESAEQRLAELTLQNGHLAIYNQRDIGTGILWYAQTLQTCGEQSLSARRAAALLISSWVPSLPRKWMTHKYGATTVCFNRDGNKVCTAMGHPGRFFSLGDACVWDIERDTVDSTESEEEFSVTSVASNVRGDLFATGSSDNVSLWDSTGKCIWTMPFDGAMCYSLAFSPDGSRLAAGGGYPPFDETAPGLVCIWDVTSPSRQQRLPHDEFVWVVGFNPINPNVMVTGSEDGKVLSWNLQSPIPESRVISASLTEDVSLLAFSSDGKTLALADQDGNLRLIDLVDNNLTATLRRHDRGIVAMTFRADNSELITLDGSGGVGIWDCTNGTLLCRRECTGGQATPSGTLSLNGRQLATVSSDAKTLIWSAIPAEIGGMRLRHLGHAVDSASFDSTGQTLLATSVGPVAKLFKWNAGCATPRILDCGKNVSMTCLSNACDLFATVSRNDTTSQAQVWDSDDISLIGQPFAVVSSLSDMKFAFDDSALLITMRERNPVLELPSFAPTDPTDEALLTATKTHLFFFRRAQSGMRAMPETMKHVVEREACDQIEFAPNGQVAAFCRGDRNDASNQGDEGLTTTDIWFRETKYGGPCFSRLRVGGTVTAMSWSPDGQLLAVSNLNRKNSSRVSLWDVRSGQCKFDEVEHDAGVSLLEFSPSGEILAAAYSDGVVRLIEGYSGRMLGEPVIYAETATDFSFSPDGLLLAVSAGHNVWLLSVPVPVANFSEHLLLSIEARCGKRVENGRVRLLTEDECSDLRARLAVLGGDCFEVSDSDASSKVRWRGSSGAVSPEVFPESGAP
jgi:WD40 repeat protein